MGISNVISLLSGIALFLFGMALMGDGLKQVAGNKLELILYRLTGNPIKGFLLGAGVTAVIQSSSATSVMIVGFVNSGMMKVRQAISIVLGAILGTSITGWIICLSDIGSTGGWLDLFSTATLTGVISVIGIVLRMTAKIRQKTCRRYFDGFCGFDVRYVYNVFRSFAAARRPNLYSYFDFLLQSVFLASFSVRCLPASCNLHPPQSAFYRHLHRPASLISPLRSPSSWALPSAQPCRCFFLRSARLLTVNGRPWFIWSPRSRA